MKRIFVFFYIIIILIILSSCSGAKSISSSSATKTDESSVVSQNFLQILYTVDTKTAEDFEYTKNIPNDITSEKRMQIINDTFANINKRFLPYTTSSCFNDLINNRTYFRYLEYAITNKCTLKYQNITLTLSQTQSDYTDYQYKAEILVIYNDGSQNQLEKEEGIIATAKENGNWKVNFIKSTSLSKFSELN